MGAEAGLVGIDAQLGQELYRNNIGILRSIRKYWDLAQRLEETSFSGKYQVLSARSGDPVICIKKGEDLIRLDSLYNPKESAKKWVDSLDLKNRLDVYVIGIGSGYHIDELKERLAGNVFAVELDLELFKVLLHLRDIKPWIESGVELLVGLSHVEFLNRLNDKFFVDKVLSRPLIVVYPPIAAQFGAEVEKYRALVRDSFINARVCVVTNVSIIGQQIENSLYNFPYLLNSPGMEVWYDLFRGLPVFCIAPGPSLKDNLDFLREHQDEAILVVVDTAAPVVQKAGISPDVVVGLDFSEANKRHYELMDLDGLKDTVLVAAVDVHKDILPMWKGPLTVFAYSHLFEDLFFIKYKLFKGITTAHTAFLFSVFSGGDPIVFFGLDLSYPDLENSHVQGTSNYQKLRLIKDSTGQLILVKQKGDSFSYFWARKVPAVNGGEVVTEDIFVSYLRDFERMIDVMPMRIIDFKTKGAKIRGAEYVSGEELIRILGEKSEEVKRVKGYLHRVARAKNVRFKRDEFRRRWAELREQVLTLTEVCRESFTALDSLYKRKEKNSALSQEEMLEINTWIDKIFDDSLFLAMRLLQNFSGAVMVMIKKFFMLRSDISDVERLETILAVLEALIKAGDDVKDMLDRLTSYYEKEDLL